MQKSIKNVEGFQGVGIGRTNGLEVVRVYVESLTCPAAKRIGSLKTYDGIPLNIKVAGKITAGVIIWIMQQRLTNMIANDDMTVGRCIMVADNIYTEFKKGRILIDDLGSKIYAKSL